MGDRRYEPPYERVVEAVDKLQVLDALSDDDVVAALAAASRAQDPYLANVLATAAHNRLRRAAAVMGNIGEGLCTLDRQGVIVQANPAASQMLGRPLEDVVGKDFHAIAHAHHGPFHAHRDACPMARLLDADATTRTEDAVSRRGVLLPVAITVSPLLADGAIEGRIVLFQDISRRKEDEALLQRQTQVLESTVENALEEIQKRKEAEERFRHLFEANPDPMVVTDGADRIVLLNACAQVTFGFGAECVGSPADVLLGPSGEGDASRAPAWRRVERDRHVTARRRDGTTFEAEVATASVPTTMGFLRVTSFRDVTARRLAEERLRRKEALLSNAETLAGIGSWEWDIESGRVAWSDELYRIYGYAPGQIPIDLATAIGHIPPEDRETVSAAITTASQGGGFEMVHRIRQADGSIRFLRSKGACVRDASGRLVQMFGTGQDVTREREVEVALRRTEAKFNQVVESVPEAILILDPDGSVAYANPAARMGHATLPRTGAEWFQAWKGKVHRADGAPFDDLDAAFWQIRDGRAVRDLHLMIEQPDGSRSFVLVNAMPLQDGERPAAVLASVRDITALHEARERYEDLNASLEQKVAEQTEMLRTANRELQAFAYTVSHDLQAPLRAIDFLADELQEGRETAQGRGSGGLVLVRKEVARMRQLIQDLLELSRLSIDDVRREPVDLSAMTKDVLKALMERDPRRTVDAQVADGLLVDADAALVRILLENLLGNAWKYTSRLDGEARIELGSAGPGTFFVRDNGAGFDMARAGALFRPFVRLHPRSEYEGTGIGLATVRRVVQKHGGRVWAESARGTGATFFFTLGGEDAPPAGDA